LLRAVSRLIRSCQWAVRSVLPAPLRAALNRWVAQGG
jgi:hypothetical protein